MLTLFLTANSTHHHQPISQTIIAAKRLFYPSSVRPPSLALSALTQTTFFTEPSNAVYRLPLFFLLYRKMCAHEDKISKLHLNLQSIPTSTPARFLPSPSFHHHFTPATLSEISNVLSQSPNSHCNLGPIPTTVLKKITNEIAARIVNLSLLTGTFTSSLKSYLISPLLKKLLLIRKIFRTIVPLLTFPLNQRITER